MTYEEAEAVLHRCDHEDRWLTVWLTGGGEIKVCTDCWNAHVAARREARKAELAEYNASLPRCQCCGRRPYKWYYGPFLLCGYCLTAAKKEHGRALAAAGNLAFIVGMQATRPLVDTTNWAANKQKEGK